MWTTLLIMAIAVSLEPIRVGLTVLMLNRPRPILQLLAFLCGGFVMGVGIGLVVLLVLRASPLASESFTVPKVQIAIGLLALTIAAVLATNVPLRRKDRGLGGAAAVAEPGTVIAAAAPPSTWTGLSTRARAVMQGSSLWVAGVSGLGIALPSVDYLAALALIHASGTSASAQIGALLGFNVVAFALVEIPLVSYLVAPQKTLAAMSALHTWVQSRTRRDVAAILAVAGLLMIGLGVFGL